MASERTPLLEQGIADPEAALLLPSLKRAVHSLSAHQVITTKHLRDVVPEGTTPASVTHLYAFLFAIPLYMELSNTSPHTGLSQSHIAHFHNSHGLVEELWTSYSVSPGALSDLDVWELLWTLILVDAEGDNGPEFTTGKLSPLREWSTCDDTRNVRLRYSVAGLLDSLPKTSFLLEQPCVSNAIELSWKYGPSQALAAGPESTLTATLRKLSAAVSPKVSHLFDAVIYTSFIACQAHVAITGLRDHFGRQDIWILVYSAYALLPFPLPPRRDPRPGRYLVPRRVGFILALLAYMTPPNDRPKPETLAHALLLLSFGWNTFRLTLAPEMTPGWILVFPLRAFLVPALEFNRLLRPVVLQPFIYFLPLVLFFGLMLTLSMDDPWSLPYVPSFESLVVSIPAPYDTREALFVFLFLSLVLLFFFSVASLIRVAATPAFLLPPTSASRSTSPQDDALSPVAARIVLRHTLLYSGRYFPAPLSLIPFLVSVPRFILQKIHAESVRDGWALATIESVLWWLLIWPSSFLLSGLWGWGYNAPRE